MSGEIQMPSERTAESRVRTDREFVEAALNLQAEVKRFLSVFVYHPEMLPEPWFDGLLEAAELEQDAIGCVVERKTGALADARSRKSQ